MCIETFQKIYKEMIDMTKPKNIEALDLEEADEDILLLAQL
jgi:hypothetical protein